MQTSAPWIEHLGLAPLPDEGGYYRRIYESTGVFNREDLPPEFGGRRFHCTSIYYSLQAPDFSAMHTLKQDEIWHFYEGATVTVCIIKPDGSLSLERMGAHFRDGEVRQLGLRAGWIFGARIAEGEGAALLGCTVAPGFEFDDFRLVGRSELMRRYPESCDEWMPYTRPD